ncbi:hypothetical protein [Leifsonia shinshuensis]|uniref:Uncharacterized protein n=1 Tax=Leifsonia shinshuensis TaxID=150026 RepID=A0A7G6Y7I0_9MICO|nr:hypothetical protein [Leifsonia shinshuensis]QNE34445.1 hypothetical protein F1C12_04390 [Leifsonia shinshuensis]
MFVEGTLRWQVTEDCPWDLLIALALRDLVGLDNTLEPALPRVSPAVVPALHGAPERGGGAATLAARDVLETQWHALFERAADREHRPLTPLLQPPHFTALDRAIELQDIVLAQHETAARWARERRAEYARASIEHHATRAADIVDVVHEREHDLRRQAGYFRLDIDVLPLAERGAWIVGPHTVVVSASLRDDSRAFRDWFRPLVAALV